MSARMDRLTATLTHLGIEHSPHLVAETATTLAHLHDTTADFYANPPTDWFEPGPDDRPLPPADPAAETAGEYLAEQRADAWRYAHDNDAPRGWGA